MTLSAQVDSDWKKVKIITVKKEHKYTKTGKPVIYRSEYKCLRVSFFVPGQISVQWCCVLKRRGQVFVTMTR